MITNFFTRFKDAINVMFLGHLGDKKLIAGVGLGGCYTGLFGMMVIAGLAMAMDTLVSQAYGAGNLEQCGVVLNRGRFISTCAYIPMLIGVFWVESFYLSMGMDPQVSKYAE